MRILCYFSRKIRGIDVNVSVGRRWEEFIDQLVKTGRYASATEIVREGLRLVEEREAKLKVQRESIEAAIAEGGENTDEEVSAYLRAHVEARRAGAR
jgi:antitoxin ParD1/3/4